MSTPSPSYVPVRCVADGLKKNVTLYVSEITAVEFHFLRLELLHLNLTEKKKSLCLLSRLNSCLKNLNHCCFLLVGHELSLQDTGAAFRIQIMVEFFNNAMFLVIEHASQSIKHHQVPVHASYW